MNSNSQQLPPLPLLTIESTIKTGSVIFHALDVLLKTVDLGIQFLNQITNYLPFLRLPILKTLELIKLGLSFGFGIVSVSFYIIQRIIIHFK